MELDAGVGEATRADLRSRQVGQHADGRPTAGGHVRTCETVEVLGEPVAEVEPDHIDAGLQTASSTGRSSLAGPSVATIFVRRRTRVDYAAGHRDASAQAPSMAIMRVLSAESPRSPDDAGRRPLFAYLDASPTPWHAVRSAASTFDGAGFAEGIDERRRGRRSARRLHHPRRRPRGLASPTAARRRLLRCASSAPTPTRRGCGSNPCRMAERSAGASSASRCTAASCSTPGSIATSASPGAGCARRHAPARPRRRADPRVPQLAIHLDRDVNERGLVLNRQAHLSPVWGTAPGDGEFAQWIAEHAGTTMTGGVGPVPVRRPARRGARRRPALLASGASRQPGVVLGRDRAGHARDRAPVQRDDRPVRPRGSGSASHGGSAGPILLHQHERFHPAAGGSRDELHRSRRRVCVG